MSRATQIPASDELIRTIGKTTITYARDAMIEEVWKIVLDDIVYLPLHYPVTVWAMRDNLDLPVYPFNRPIFRERQFRVRCFFLGAAFQAWAQAVEMAGTFETKAVAEALRRHEFDTVLERIGLDAKGDVTGYDTFIWYVWKDGNFAPVDWGKFTD
jgi:hypothetical protein